MIVLKVDQSIQGVCVRVYTTVEGHDHDGVGGNGYCMFLAKPLDDNMHNKPALPCSSWFKNDPLSSYATHSCDTSLHF